MEVISKNKPKGKAYSKIKAKRKQTRILQEKAIKQRTENKRINAENRKANLEYREFMDRVSEVEIVEFKKNMLIIDIDGELEKRALLFDKRKVNKKNLAQEILDFKIKLFGEEVYLRKLGNFEEKKEELLFALEEFIG
ncbi:hypothetical protein I6E17_01285 [Fusobacterium perfoetens]|uniref:hypothetical protein n=1 Tax=Fusobacterium perfoetens TaxID=852 RepID=UPI001F3A65AE|nr:hypothetical protein [Fusobacterium perfoetens]MCF2624808.1 hypothetical protein [Fusobacterium perfoetens]